MPAWFSPASTGRTGKRSRAALAGAFAGPLKGSRVIDQPQDVRFLNEDTAIVISEGGIVFPGQNAVPSEGTVRATWVLAKRDGRWHVAAYHYSAANKGSGYEAASLVLWEAASYPGGLSGWSYGREWASAEMPRPPGTALIV